MVFFADVGGFYVANIEFFDDLGSLYIFADYNLNDDGSLSIWFMDQSLIVEEVEQGYLRGAITYDEFDDYVTLTEDRSTLLSLIQHYDRETLFSLAWGPFYRQ